MKGDPLWLDDVHVLAARWQEFFPAAGQTPAERVNALVRLIAYASLAAFAWNRQARTLVVGGAVIAVVTLAARGREPYPWSAAVSTSDAAPDGCTRPTRDNPFANELVTDIGKNRPAACPYDSVKGDVRERFNDGLFRDALDVYEVGNSQRQFYTMPTSGGIPDTAAWHDDLNRPHHIYHGQPIAGLV